MSFICTSPFRLKDKQYSRSVVVPLPPTSAGSQAIVNAALTGLQGIYRPGYRCPNAGVMLMDLIPADRCQRELLLNET